MKIILRALPVLYACQGCAEFGQKARDLGALFEQAGALEMVWLGCGRELTPTSRFPVFALDGCRKACALRWLERHGIAAERSFVIEDRAAR
jgi:uncharacterized metal-binding protein